MRRLSCHDHGTASTRNSTKLISLALSRFARILLRLAAFGTRLYRTQFLLKSWPPPDTIALPAARAPRQRDTSRRHVRHGHCHPLTRQSSVDTRCQKSRPHFFQGARSGTSTSQISPAKRRWAARNRCAKAGEARSHGAGSRFLRLLPVVTHGGALRARGRGALAAAPICRAFGAVRAPLSLNGNFVSG